jgi:hypothetical protein
MAKIQGISNCTRFLIEGMQPVNGKKFATFEDIISFKDNYSTILSDTKKIVTKQQDELIESLTLREIRLNDQIHADIARREEAVKSHIKDLHNKVEECEPLLWKISLFLDYFVAKLKSYRGIYPSTEAVQELRDIQKRKAMTIKQKPLAIESAEKSVIAARWSLTFNTSFLIGAEGEEQVIQRLSKLSDEYHILNDVNFKEVDFKNDKPSPDTYQIDHIVIGPTGLFLIETKNWKTLDSELKIQKLGQQVRRSNNALRRYLKVKYGDVIPWIQSIAVSVHGNQSKLKISPYVDIVTPNQLYEYIVNRTKSLPTLKIQKLVELIPCREAN